MDKKIIVITGPSGIGKTTLSNFILDKNNQLSKVRTCTTRQKRSEQDDYIFVDVKEFKEFIVEDKLLEWSEVYENSYYGILSSEINKIWQSHKVPVVVLDAIGAEKIKKYFGSKCLSIFLLPTSTDELKHRLNSRGADPNIDARIAKAEFEISFASKFDLQIKNSDIFETYSEISNQINKFIESTLVSKTLIVNMFSGPGVGKSTIAASLFAELKYLGYDVELVTEYVKDKVWEDSLSILNNQIYIFGKQHQRIFRLLDKVQIIVTDSPLLQQLVYSSNHYLNDLIISEVNKFNNLNIFLKRIHTYNPVGRLQTESAAKEIDQNILNLVVQNAQPNTSIFTEGDRKIVKPLIEEIIKRLI